MKYWLLALAYINLDGPGQAPTVVEPVKEFESAEACLEWLADMGETIAYAPNIDTVLLMTCRLHDGE